MPESEGAHIARLEERITGVREDLVDLMAELNSARRRLHDLEGIAGAFSDAQRIARQREEAQYRRLRFTISILAVVVAIAAIVVPLVEAVVLGK